MTGDKERSEHSAARPGAKEISEAEIDQELIGTFPASDPPPGHLGWNALSNRNLRPISAWLAIQTLIPFVENRRARKTGINVASARQLIFSIKSFG